MPERIQLSRAKGWRKPPGAVVVSRPSRWGNPFPIDGDAVPDRETSVALYRAWAATGPPELADVDQLRGRDLCCWCPLDGPCHADVLLGLANRDGPASDRASPSCLISAECIITPPARPGVGLARRRQL